MNYVKTLGLAAMVLAALLTVAGTASADRFTAPKGFVYTGEIHAESHGTELTSVFGGFGAVSCAQATWQAKVTTHSTTKGVPVGAHITSWHWQQCSNPVTVINKGSLSFTTTNEGEATVRSIGQTITIHETLFGTCNFITSASPGTTIGTLTGTSKTGGKAILDIKASMPSENGCGTGTWEGSYTITFPSPLYFD